MSNRLTQHEIRKIALQVLYSMEIRPDQDLSKLESYIFDERKLSEENKKFLDFLISGVQKNRAVIHQELSKFLMATWSIDRLTMIDRIILEIGAFEIVYTEVADKIAIDEAINLARDFSNTAAVKLINGILTNLIKK